MCTPVTGGDIMGARSPSSTSVRNGRFQGCTMTVRRKTVHVLMLLVLFMCLSMVHVWLDHEFNRYVNGSDLWYGLSMASFGQLLFPVAGPPPSCATLVRNSRWCERVPRGPFMLDLLRGSTMAKRKMLQTQVGRSLCGLPFFLFVSWGLHCFSWTIVWRLGWGGEKSG